MHLFRACTETKRYTISSHYTCEYFSAYNIFIASNFMAQNILRQVVER